ncbi:hypothetical protein [Rhabdaerophilum sp. SD176]|uniref:TadE/TadG family type IV pilus assembly protein n=1 Tax=Rhabdaerophilum sp. SD176 TaxID=2983548 RepID=UPI0024DFB498|nr:hypothetical protein [Rhabdaerophilum sp. SD176]
MFALSLPALLAVGAGTAEFMMATQKQVALQGLTDSAAIAIARQMTVANPSLAEMQAIARGFAGPFEAQHGPVALQPAPGPEAGTVRVQASFRLNQGFGFLASIGGVDSVSASSTAKAGGSSKLCLLSIDEARADARWAGAKMFLSKDANGLHLGEGARITAPGCTLHTNFKTRDAFIIEAQAKVTADLLCAAGGIRNLGGSLDAELVTDCPRLPNPLETRNPTSIKRKCGLAEYRVWEFREGTHTLQPGRYCGDIVIGGTAKVRLNAGEYAIQGKFLAGGDSEVVGDGIALYFYGGIDGHLRPSYFRFTGNALVDLTAPEKGAMAGILIWEGVNGAVSDLSNSALEPEGANYHRISSARARRLTGTIYLPAGQLRIDAPVVVADRSDYTLLVINRLELARGPNLVLNSNYARSRVPVPPGLGPVGAKEVRLIK